MCNVPCNLCGDYDGCNIKDNEIYFFKVYENNCHVLNLLCTKKSAEEFSFQNPEKTLILMGKYEDEDNEFNPD